MRVLHAAAEVFPLVKTGGLADVLGALPQALANGGADVRLVVPGWPAVLQGVEKLTLISELGALFGAGKVSIRLGQLPNCSVQVYVVDAPYLFQRKGNPYLGPDGKEWGDNLQRFGLLGWVAAHLAAGELDSLWCPDILHAHDWHAAMAFAYVRAHPGVSVKTVFTVHNLAYQGLFDEADFHLLGLPARLMVPTGLEFHGQLSFMKAGLAYSDRVTTVSPSYAHEIATSEFGCGLEGLIRARGSDVSGILNGVDSAVWDPAADGAIAAPYSALVMGGKSRCKIALQKTLGLRVNDRAPLFGLVSRLTEQKGLDLVLAAIPAMLESGAQLAVQGSGDPALEAAFSAAAAKHPGQVAVRLGYDETFAHQMMAGADAMLVPSRFEPCGLTQLYALRYGTVPVVRHVGGLIDTVMDSHTESLHCDAATGFVFGPASAEALAEAVVRAIQAYAQPKIWRKIMLRGMAQEFSWERSAAQYLALYNDLLVV